ncbi:MAG: hypothetical protein OZ934_10500 [Anaerolineae bacterium]|nr:hypothetical protein [Anaerolineae bacterium]
MSHLVARFARTPLQRVLVLAAWVLALTGALLGGQPAQAATDTFANLTAIAAGPPAGPGSLYPSQIVVAGLAGNILDVNVTLHGISHNRPDDLDVLLVGPLGQTVILMSDSCGDMNPGGADFTFDDEAAAPLPDTDGGTACVTGTYQPWNYAGLGTDDYSAPAPAGPYGTTLSVFDGTVANGTWSLYIMDDRDFYGGSIGGWSLTIESEDVPVEPGEPALPIITAEDVLRSQAAYCANLTGETNPIVRADIPSGTVTNGGVYCRVIAENGAFVAMHNGAAAIGNADVLAQGVIHAVDVFGMAGGTGFVAFNNPIEVCLQGSGRFLFLNAATSPRALSQLPAYSQDGYTCASVPGAGTVVLVP